MNSLNEKLNVKLRNKSWKPECVGNFNMDWQILVFYPEPEARDKIDYYTVKPVYSGHTPVFNTGRIMVYQCLSVRFTCHALT